MEAMLSAKKLGQLIQKVLPDYTDPLDFTQLCDTDGVPYSSPKAVDRAASAVMREWMGIPPALNPIAALMETAKAYWQTLYDGSANPTRYSPRSQG
jgi:hypothetical protein